MAQLEGALSKTSAQEAFAYFVVTFVPPLFVGGIVWVVGWISKAFRARRHETRSPSKTRFGHLSRKCNPLRRSFTGEDPAPTGATQSSPA